jgi:hypothetical protein
MVVIGIIATALVFLHTQRELYADSYFPE